MSKKIFFSFIVFVINFTSFNAQRHEIGIRFGNSNLVGDIGRTNYILQKPLSTNDISQVGLPVYAGLIYRMNFNPYQTLRFDVGYNHLQFDDRVAKEEYRRNRQIWGTNSLWEASAIFEYNFFPINNEQEEPLLSPYIFAGIGGLVFDANQANINHDFRRDKNGVAQAPVDELDFITTTTYSSGKKFTMSVPFGAGLKYKFNYNWMIFGEVMIRPTFSDQIDYSELKKEDIETSFNTDILAPSTNSSLLQTGVYNSVAQEREAELLRTRQIGNPNSKDWVNSVTLGITYSFGRPPCYCE